MKVESAKKENMTIFPYSHPDKNHISNNIYIYVSHRSRACGVENAFLRKHIHWD